MRGVRLEDEPRGQRQLARGVPPWAAWLLGPLMLVASLTAIAIVFRGPEFLFGILFGAAVVLGLGWMLVSALHPAVVDRRCPSCAENTLIRRDPRSTRGVECRACGYEDETESSFLFAEEEGENLEELVMQDRDQQSGRIPKRW